MSIRIERIDVENNEELRLIHQISAYAFHPSPSHEEVEKRLELAKYRSESDQFLLYDNDEPVASATIHPMTQNLRGTVVDVGGVATIGTLPHARRKGHVSRLMSHLFYTMHENNQALSVLHPFKQSFYARYGYVKLPDRHWVKFKPGVLQPISNIQLDNMEIIHGLVKDNLDDLLSIQQSVQKLTKGMMRFTRLKMKEIETEEYWLTLVKEDGLINAAMIYEISGYLEDMNVLGFYSRHPKGRYKLLEFMQNHTDHVENISMQIRNDCDFDRWLFDINFTSTYEPGAMTRIIDMNKLSDLQIPVGKGKVRIQIEDTYCKWNNHTYELSSNTGTLLVKKVDNTSENIVDIMALSSLIYGYYDIEELKLRGWINCDDRTIMKLTHLFPYDPHQVMLYF